MNQTGAPAAAPVVAAAEALAAALPSVEPVAPGLPGTAADVDP
ncbi:MAG: flagellar motor protein MotB, partial [Nocardioidaceae bacterium]|nr:flagellar motor protein MotB [Nocardioidaceae bacterium]